MEYKDIHNEITRVASHYEFHKTPDFIISILEKINQLIRLIREWLDSLHSFLPESVNSKTTSNILVVILYIAGAVTAVLIIYWIIKRSQVEKLRKNMQQAVVRVEPILDSSAWKSRASEFAAKQNYKEACRALYFSLLQLLHERKIAVFAPTKSNYEYRLSLRKHPAFSNGFAEISNIVELIWFGNKDASMQDYDFCFNQLRKLEAEINVS